MNTHARSHLIQIPESLGKGLRRAGSNSYSSQEGFQEQTSGPPHLPSPTGEQLLPPSTHKPNRHSAIQPTQGTNKGQNTLCRQTHPPTWRPQHHRLQPVTLHLPPPKTASPTCPQPPPEKPVPGAVSLPSLCYLHLHLHPSTSCSLDPSSHAAPHQPSLQSLSKLDPSPYLQPSGHADLRIWSLRKQHEGWL